MENIIINAIKNTDTDWLEIESNIIDKFNDSISIFIKKKENKLFVSDDSLILKNLSLNKKEINLNNIINLIKKEFEKNNLIKYINLIEFNKKELILICDFSKLETDNKFYKFIECFLNLIKKILDCPMV